jgi:hypothetical protein
MAEKHNTRYKITNNTSIHPTLVEVVAASDIPLLYLIRKRLPGRKPYPKWLLLALILVGPMAMVAQHQIQNNKQH